MSLLEALTGRAPPTTGTAPGDSDVFARIAAGGNEHERERLELERRRTIPLVEITLRLPPRHVDRFEGMSDADHADDVAHFSRLGHRLSEAMGCEESPIEGTDRYLTGCPACPDPDASELVYARNTASTIWLACLAGCEPTAIAEGMRRVIAAHDAEAAREREAVHARAVEDERARLEASVSILALGEAHDQTWAIEGLVPDGSLTLLAGASGSGKTFAALGWAISIATGRPFCGRAARQGRVLCVCLDGGNKEINRRLERLAAGMGTTRSELAGRVDLSTDPLDVTNQLSLAHLVRLLNRIEYTALLIDNLTEIRGSGSENDASVLSAAMRPLAHLAQGKSGPRPLAVVVLHHANAAGDVRGSTAIKQHADHVLELARGSDKNEAVIEIVRGKSRSGGGQDLRLRFVDHPNGAIVPTPVEPAGKPAAPSPEVDPVRARMLSLVATTPMGSDALATTIAKELGVRKASVVAMRRTLEGEGLISQGDDDRWRSGPGC